MHALIIEDQCLISMAIEDALLGCGFASCDIAVSMEGAVMAAEKRCPDLITADVKLAPGCGITAVERICHKKAVPVLFITGSLAELRIRLPGHPVVEKPFSTEQIVRAVEQLIDVRNG